MASVQILHWCYQGLLFFSPSLVCECVHVCVCVCVCTCVLVLNAHNVYTCCNHFMDIFERQIVKCQICLFAVLQGPGRGRAASMCICGARFYFDCSFPVGIKRKRSNIYCLGCRGRQDKHGQGIVLIITGIKLFLEGKISTRTDWNFFLSRCAPRFLDRQMWQALSCESSTSVGLPPPLLFFSLARCLSSCVIPSTFFGKRACAALL